METPFQHCHHQAGNRCRAQGWCALHNAYRNSTRAPDKSIAPNPIPLYMRLYCFVVRTFQPLLGTERARPNADSRCVIIALLLAAAAVLL